MNPSELLIRVLDVVGTFVFALSGATLGVRRSLDVFGVLVLAFVTAVAGGITRDVLLGAVPPAAIASAESLGLSLVAGLLVFKFYGRIERLNRPVQFFDAVGLGVFAVAGTQKALDFGLVWPMAAVLGMLSGIGGGVVRDVLTTSIPSVLREEIYAVAALAGGLVVVAGAYVGVPPVVVTFAGIALCLFLRLMSLYRGWRLPVARSR